jgi:hypothetical protein
MHAPGDDRFFAELSACTAELARIIDGDLERPVPTCPGYPAPASGWSHVRRRASPSSMATAKPASRSAGPQPASCLS